jgi:hypothetical protein
MARKSFPKLVRVSSPPIYRGEFLLSSLGLIEVFGAIALSSIHSEDLIISLKSPESLPVLKRIFT